MAGSGRFMAIGASGFRWTGIAMALLWLMVPGCTTKEPVGIGFAGELTGRNADLGVQGRNGAMLAVETVNRSGGIAGRPIELIVRDDRGTPQGARTAGQQLIDAGVVAIVGHMTSGQSMAGREVTEQAGKLMLSPTASTSRLTGIDDHFLRIQPAITAAAGSLARLARRRHLVQRIAIIADEDNLAYSDAYRKAFVEAFVKSGGEVIGTAAFASSAGPDFDPLLRRLLRSQADGLLIIASALDTAFIAQRARVDGFAAPLFSSGWAQTEDLIHNGGQAVEGLIMVVDYDIDSRSASFRTFEAQYRERFGRPPIFAAAQAYEAVMILSEALKHTAGEERGLKQALLDIRDFDGLVGSISMDPYGDVTRTQFVVTVRNGRFRTLSAIDS